MESSRGLSAATPPENVLTPITTLKGSGNDLEKGTAPAPLQGACRSGREPGVSLPVVAHPPATFRNASVVRRSANFDCRLLELTRMALS